MALLSAYHVIAADSAVAVAALAHLRVFFVQRNTLTCLCAVGVDAETNGIRRRRLCLYSFNRVTYVLNLLIQSATDVHGLGAL